MIDVRVLVRSTLARRFHEVSGHPEVDDEVVAVVELEGEVLALAVDGLDLAAGELLLELLRRDVLLGDALAARLCFLHVLTRLHVDCSDALADVFLLELTAKHLDLG